MDTWSVIMTLRWGVEGMTPSKSILAKGYKLKFHYYYSLCHVLADF